MIDITGISLPVEIHLANFVIDVAVCVCICHGIDKWMHRAKTPRGAKRRGRMSGAVGWFGLTFAAIIVLDSFFDVGKWALGRHTDTGAVASILTIIGFSALLALAMELIHRRRRKAEAGYTFYEHHGVKVAVRRDLKGRHWEPQMCGACAKFCKDTGDDCPVAMAVHELGVERHLVLVVWECPEFAQVNITSTKGLKSDLVAPSGSRNSAALPQVD